MILARKGKYIRRKSPEHLIREIKQTRDSYGISSVVFSDDLFVSDIKWLEEFSGLYRAEIGIPFFCTARADTIKERHVELLAESGCHTVSMGVETGNERLRKMVLKKTVSDNDIKETARRLKDKGIKLQTSNMFCLPGETIADAISTIDLNISIKADYMFNLVFLPYPKTELADYCIQNGMLKKDFTFEDMPESFILKSVLDIEDKSVLENIQKVAFLCFKYPKIKPLLVYLAKKMRSDKVFFLFYLLGTFIRYKEEKSLKFFEALRFLWSFRKGY